VGANPQLCRGAAGPPPGLRPPSPASPRRGRSRGGCPNPACGHPTPPFQSPQAGARRAADGSCDRSLDANGATTRGDHKGRPICLKLRRPGSCSLLGGRRPSPASPYGHSDAVPVPGRSGGGPGWGPVCRLCGSAAEAPTRPAATLPSTPSHRRGDHKGCPYRWGDHKGRPYRWGDHKGRPYLSARGFSPASLSTSGPEHPQAHVIVVELCQAQQRCCSS